MRVTAGANAWMNVEGVVGDRRISRKGKGNVLSSCVTGAKRADRRRMDELRVEVGVKESFKKKIGDD